MLEIMNGFILCVVHTYGIFRIFGILESDFYNLLLSYKVKEEGGVVELCFN